VFDGPNILLILHIDHFYTLQNIAIFIFGPFGLKLAIHTPFWGVLGDFTPNEMQNYCCNPHKDCPWAKTRRMSHKP